MNWSNRTLEELIGLWLLRREERREVAYQRARFLLENRRCDSVAAQSEILRLGMDHGDANHRVVMLEEEIISRFPGAASNLPDGRRVEIGKPGCRLHDRIVVKEVASTQEEESK